MKRLYKSTAAILLFLPMSMATLAAEPQKTPEPVKGMAMHDDMGKMENMTEAQKAQHTKSLQEHIKKSR